MTERFKKAYDSLVRAFFEGTLAKGTCVACACGNIIFDAVGITLTKKDVVEASIELTKTAKELWSAKRGYRLGLGYYAFSDYRDEINAAGYTAKEFAAIENAFEENTWIGATEYRCTTEQEILEDQYKGLCAVVDVLIKLDEIEEGAEEYKQKFREHPKLSTVEN